MSNNKLFNALPVLLMTLFLGGCITTDVTITLEPDGSGTLEYTQNFDRAPEELRAKIRHSLNSPGSTKDTAKENILEEYPEPHFTLLTHEDSNETLTTRVVLQFNDINALLIPRKTADLGLKSLHFTVDGDDLIFTAQEDETRQTWPEKYDETPGHETITIISAQNGEKITFSREVTSKTEPADWTGTLKVSGHSIVRTPNLQVFHNYPVSTAPACSITRANWNLRQSQRWSALEIDLLATLPNDNCTYIRWEKPVALSGGFLPKEPGYSRLTLTGQAAFDAGRSSKIQLKLPIPEDPKESLTNLTVRIQATRTAGSKIVDLGELKPNTEYTVEDVTIQTEDLQNDKLSIKITGASDRLKDTWLQTRRGNRFKLKWSSKSGISEKNISFWESFPLEGASLCVELYNPTERCYIDLTVPTLDLTQRAWKTVKDEAANEATDNWTATLKAEHPDLFSIDIPPVEAAMFEDQEIYKAYFQALENEQLMPAIAAVVDYMVRNNPKKGEVWIQEIAQYELQGRSEYFEANRKTIANQLFGIYQHTPKKMGCIAVFFVNLNLKEFSQPLAIEALQTTGASRFASDNLFTSTIPEEHQNQLNSYLLSHNDWMAQLDILRVLNNAHCADQTVLRKLIRNESVSEHTRFWALNYLMKQTPFPLEELTICLTSPDCQKSAPQHLKNYISRHMTKDTLEQRKELFNTLQPILPLIEDLAEQINEYKAREAVEALEKIRELEASVQQQETTEP